MLPTRPVLKEICDLDRSLASFPHRLSYILHGPEYDQCVLNLGDNDLAWLINYLDGVLDDLDPSFRASQKCLHELRNICGTEEVLPKSFALSSRLLKVDSESFTVGDRSDVFKGTLDGLPICVKRMRVYRDNHKRNSQIFHQGAVIWKRMRHPNILRLRGIPTAPIQFTFISDFMPGGTLREYIRSQPNADRLGLLSGVAKGLHYLHSYDVVHGRIKGLNVVVDDFGHALITGFSCATIEGQDSAKDDSGKYGFNVQWTAPEILNEGTLSKRADIFSFAMVMIEVFTCAAPFAGRSNNEAMLDIVQGRRPPRPQHPAVTGRLWRLIQRCWNQDPRRRPEAVEVLEELLASDPPAWKQLITHALSMNERISLITSICSDPDEAKLFEYLSKDDAQAFVDVVDEALVMLSSLSREIRMRCLRASYRVCGRQALLPTSLQIPLCYEPSDTPRCCGGFADVWKGKHLGREVAAKGLRVCETDDFDRVRKEFCREVMMWRTLRHPNVLPLLGVTMIDRRFVMVSEWMDNGNINEFLKNNADADRVELLRDVTEGLIYMHEWGIVHGDLKGTNIMINNECRACVTDFSLITLAPDHQTFLSSCIEGGTYAWMSPELLSPTRFGLDGGRPTMASDHYGLGMVIYEVLSGQAPFKECGSLAVILKILDGERPKRPQGGGGRLFTDKIWDMVQLCWRQAPSDRASAREVLQCL